jgi:hypothetical protein
MSKPTVRDAMHRMRQNECVRQIMRELEPIQLSDGQTLLIIVKDGRVIEFTWDMGLPHVEFVKRRVVELPTGAWGRDGF